MAVKIRLRRMGGNDKPFFRVVATDERCPNEGRFLETLGWYDPKKKGTNYELKVDRIQHWVGNGAIVTDTVKSLMKKYRGAERRKAAPAATASA
jgi:small subunit ribosomal protein S16